ncbi:Gfo/Idh/MocA family protein [Geomicrobium sp. JCM 19039]|uniref:Gfo/Idh/MocA family protein n=1 Tax=Geomicrobium sp. JCM 19039 TaxID=1460636 RepID=UPI00045F3346|nr:Gfo/Idh/MocA family oxidoreductase [Geomicrobium sp. JCM 19039]GAK12275.1 oxidoreductase [Geomicrobium sp. JCM 19039]
MKTYTPNLKLGRAVQQGEFNIAAIGLDHNHIYGMCKRLADAGASVKWVYDPDPHKTQWFKEKFPEVEVAPSAQTILEDQEVHMVAAAPIPSERGELGLKVHRHGKHYFTAKTPFTSIQQLEKAKEMVRQTGKVWAVNYSERIAVESAVFAGQLIEEGAIGRVVQVIGTGPHKLKEGERSSWFFEKEKYGGILCDIGSHQVEQFLTFSGAKRAEVVFSRTENYAHPDYPELEDFGEVSLKADNGASNYFRVDWLTPDGLHSWGDGRTFILGTDGYIELRKNLDLMRSRESDHLFLVNHEGEQYFSLKGKVGLPFYHHLIGDCLHGTEKAMTQEHAFLASELSLKAQNMAERERGG